MKPYVHQEIGKEVQSISATLTVFDEIHLDYKGREVLCILSAGVIDNACCGSGGCLLIEVPGILLSSDREKNETGQRISKVVPIEEEEEKKEISALLTKRFPSSQIRFD
jgi:hypothetical protein